MFKTLTIKPAKIILATLATLLLINAQVVSAQDKPTLNRAVLLENKVELPSNNINAKIIRVTFRLLLKLPGIPMKGQGPVMWLKAS